MLDGELSWIADVDWACGLAIHEPDHSFDQVVDVAERAGLAAIAIKGQRFPLDGLNDEIADNQQDGRQHVGDGSQGGDGFDPSVVGRLISTSRLSSFPCVVRSTARCRP